MKQIPAQPARLPGKSGPSPAAIAEASPLGVPAIPARAVRRVVAPLPGWKRAVDLTLCTLALPVLALCTLVMSILTSLVSPGPVFFRQVRIGHRGRRFKIYKFRTMHLSADNVIHHNHVKHLIGTNAPMTKLDSRGDARLIPGAWLLRASGLDELPQLLNVFRGEMSLVGPRPCLPAEFELYAPAQRERCEVLPGLTGLWQVSGKNRTTFEEMIELDVQYARRFSLRLDLKIILLTGPSLFRQMLDTRRARKMAEKSTRHGDPVMAFRPSSDSRPP